MNSYLSRMKKAAACFLAFVMVFALMPSVVSAEDNNTFKVYFYDPAGYNQYVQVYGWYGEGGSGKEIYVPLSAEASVPAGWRYAEVTLPAETIKIKVLRYGGWEEGSPQAERTLTLDKPSIYVIAGNPIAFTSIYTYNIKYHREDGNYDGWYVHTWSPSDGHADEDAGNLGVKGNAIGGYNTNFAPPAESGYWATATYYDVNPYIGFVIMNGSDGKEGTEDREFGITSGTIGDFYVVSGDDDVYTEEPEHTDELYTYNLYYYRYDHSYGDWNAWVWADNTPDASKYFSTAADPDGWSKTTFTSLDPSVQFLIKKGPNWDVRDVTANRTLEIAEGAQTGNFYVVQDDKSVYAEPINVVSKVKSALSDAPNQIVASLTNDPGGLEDGNFYILDVEADVEIGITSISGRSGTSVPIYDITTSSPMTPNKLYKVMYRDTSKLAGGNVTMKGMLDSFTYDGDDLGVAYESGLTTFKVWAPTASEVSVVIYDGVADGDYDDKGKIKPEKLTNEFEDLDGEYGSGDAIDGDGEAYSMDYTLEQGLYSVEIEGNLLNKYYMYKVTQPDGSAAYAVDPYATAVSANGQLTAIVDMEASADLPKGPYPDDYNKTDSILYEMHIRDFSIDDSAGVEEENRGKFTGISTGTTLPEDDSIKTGIDHLVELGITTVHLLPVFDFASVNELNDDLTDFDETSLSGNTYPKNFNWGYDPQNYNVPEGSYSTEPTMPIQRIEEFKEMVTALHEEGIRVVMDVVYNHTYSVEDGPFEKIVPTYFYRTDAEGKLMDASGCGNEVATEKTMARKYIIDSLLYWQREYGIDGFRFDLMTIIDGQTMKDLTKALRENDPNVIVYGEPWAAGSASIGEELQVKTDNFQSMWSGNDFAIFNEKVRKAIKGDSDDNSKGFATEGAGIGDIKAGVYGGNNLVGRASESINYATAHDNLNLWDKIRYSLGNYGTLANFHAAMKTVAYDGIVFADSDLKINGQSPFATPDKSPFLGTGNGNAALQSDVLSTGILMTMQGIPFFQAGDEFLRTKQGDHNSYSSNDDINAIRWENKKAYLDVFNYYKGIIQLRNEHPAFRMDEYSDIQANITDLGYTGNVVAFKIGPYANGDSWKNIYVAYNGGSVEANVNFGVTGLNVVVNHEHAGIEKFGNPTTTNSYTLPARSMVVLYDEEPALDLHHVLIDPRTSERIDDVDSGANVKDYSPVDETPIELLENETLQLSVSTFNEAYRKVTLSDAAAAWTSANPAIAEVSANGLVTAKGEGETAITVTVTRDGVVKAAKVNIKVTELTVEFLQPEIHPQQQAVLSVHGSNSIQSVTANLSSIGGGPSVSIASLVPGKFEKTVSVADTGEYSVPVTVTLKNGTTIEKSATLNVIENPEDTFDWDEARIYFLLTDRFSDGGSSTGSTLANRIKPSGEDYSQVFDGEATLSQLNTYHGGNLAGVAAKVEYLKSLGVNTVWVTPLVDNIEFDVGGAATDTFGYAGYWAKTFEAIDEELATGEDLEALASALHAQGMKLMVDVVLNHGGYGMNEEVEDGWKIDYNNDLLPTIDQIGKFILPNGLSMFRNFNGDGRIKHILAGLPDFKTEDPQVRDLLVKWQSQWMKTYDIDYFRVDTVKHIENDTWRAFKNAVVGANPSFKMIGEHYAGNINRLGSNEGDGVYSEDYLAVDQLDSILDFDFNNIALGFVTWQTTQDVPTKNDPLTQVNIQNPAGERVPVSDTAGALAARDDFFDSHPLLTLGSFLSSHDEDGFATRFEESVAAKLKYAELMNAASLQITSRGQPVIYYGEEIAQFGKYSNHSLSKFDENRYDFDWTLAGQKPLMLQHYTALLNSRDDYSKVFSRGVRTYNTEYGEDADGVEETNGDAVLSFTATLDDDPTQTVLVAINRADKDQLISFSGTLFEEGSVLKDIYAEKRLEMDSYEYGEDVEVGSNGNIAEITVPNRNEGGVVVYVLDADLQVAGDKYVKVGQEDISFEASGSVLSGGKEVSWSLVDPDSDEEITEEAELTPDEDDPNTAALEAKKAGVVRVKATVDVGGTEISNYIDVIILDIEGDSFLPVSEDAVEYKLLPDELLEDENVLSIEWSSSDEEIIEIQEPEASDSEEAELSNTVAIIALKPGTATLTATVTFADGTTEDIEVEKEITVVDIEGPLVISVGDEQQLYSLLPEDLEENDLIESIEWSVNDGSLAEIDEDTGELTAKAAGTVTVIATINFLDEEADPFVLELEVEIVGIEGKTVIPVGSSEIYSLVNEALEDNELVDEIVWSVDYSSLAEIDSETGELVAIASGNVTVKATVSFTDDTPNLLFELEVTIVELTGPTIVAVGSDDSDYQVEPSDSIEDDSIEWEISGEGSGNFDGSTLTAEEAGAATVKATITIGDEEVILEKEIYIIDIHAPDVMTVNSEADITLTPSGAGDKISSVSWSVSAGTITSDGKLTAGSTAGTITVTAVVTPTVGDPITLTKEILVVAIEGPLVVPVSTDKVSGQAETYQYSLPGGTPSDGVDWSVTGSGSIDDDGNLTATAAGRLTVKATYDGTSVELEVTVVEIKGDVEVTASDTETYQYTLEGTNAKFSVILGQATITEGGELTATGEGTVLIKATTDELNGLYAVLEITVEEEEESTTITSSTEDTMTSTTSTSTTETSTSSSSSSAPDTETSTSSSSSSAPDTETSTSSSSSSAPDTETPTSSSSSSAPDTETSTSSSSSSAPDTEIFWVRISALAEFYSKSIAS
ncbi:MAG: Ig-like domain-containing protein, partial [Clostridiales bacterium]|nr:Ig-like domain-containing protein [Clostridiales bacterium]